MMTARGTVWIIVLAICATGPGGCRRDQRSAWQQREQAYRANNLGVAQLELANFDEATAAFRGAIALDGALAIPHLNLSLARLYAQDLPAAAAEANVAARLMPESPRPWYVLGLIARADSRADEAARFFERVRRIDPADAGARVNLAQIHLQSGRHQDAISLLRPVIDDEPHNVTATYALGLALARSGAAAEGQRLLERSQALQASGYGVAFGAGYLEQGRYAEGVVSTGAEPELVDRAAPPAAFSATTILGGEAAPSPFDRTFPGALAGAAAESLARALGGCLAPIDFDEDGDPDLFEADAGGAHLLRNDAGTFVDVTAASGLAPAPAAAVTVGCVAGDYDNDGRADLFVLRYGRSALYRNEGAGRFREVTGDARLPSFDFLPGAAAFVDVDHDGDLDLVVAGLADPAATPRRAAGRPLTFPRDFPPAPARMLRNNGNGTFVDITRASRLDAIAGHAIAIVPADFDDRRDVDLLIVNRDSPPRLLKNMRDGTFADVTAETRLADLLGSGDAITGVTAGDVNKDGFPDLFFARAAQPVLALGDGRGRFTAGRVPENARGLAAAQLIDYDNDGLLDVWVQTVDAAPRRLFRNIGQGWTDVTAAAMRAGARPAPAGAPAPARVVVADLDRDGDEDVIELAGGVTLWRNTGDRRNASLSIGLEAVVSNRLGIGSKVEVLAGTLRSRVETVAATPPVAPADVLFGLGPRRGADVARVLWPSGILQTEIGQASTPGAPASLPSTIRIHELDRKPSSCPFLFTWNGERFEFVTDFLGAGEMGYWEGPGRWNVPDPVEYVRITDDQLRAKDGLWRIRITNELEETLYLDRLELVVVSHPADVFVVPNEGMTDPPKPFRIHAVRGIRPPRRVLDDRGRDVTELVARLDRRAPADFPLERFRGYAAEHALVVDVGAGGDSAVLLLTGWTDYAYSSDNRAAHQAGLALRPPALEVRDARGRWRTLVADIGIPVGRPQTVPIELTGLRPGEHEIRLVTNMRIYWDRILVGTAARETPIQISRVDPGTATLRERGFSREILPDGRAPILYDYARVSTASPWKVMPGRYTRLGDVLERLTASDDRFVIARPGDEIAVDFSASAARRDRAGWTHTFLLAADGFSKEMDINSASPDAVAPLPFHGMRQYPYTAPDGGARPPAHRRDVPADQTRVVPKAIALLELSLGSGR